MIKTLVDCVQEDLIGIDEQLSDNESIWSIESVEDANYQNYSDSDSKDESFRILFFSFCGKFIKSLRLILYLDGSFPPCFSGNSDASGI